MSTEQTPLSIGAQGAEVGLLHRELAQLGGEIPQEEAQAALFGPGTHAAVLKLQAAYGLEPTAIIDARTSAALQQAIDEVCPRTLRGRVLHFDGMPAGDLHIRLLRKFLTEEAVVTSTYSGVDGSYTLGYTLRDLGLADVGQLALRVAAVDGNGQELVGSPAIYAPQRDESHDLRLNDRADLRAQHIRLRTALAPILAQTRLATLRPDQVTHLSRVTAFAEEHLLAVVESARQADALNLPEDMLYMLRATGIVATGDALLEARPLQLAALIVQCRAAGHIDDAAADALMTFVTVQLPDIQAARLLRPAEPGQPPSLGDRLQAIPSQYALTDPQTRAFARATLEQATDGSNLWDLAQQHAELGPREINTLKVTYALQELTGFHPDLMAALHERRQEGEDSLRFLTQLRPIDWLVQAYTHGVPAGSALAEADYAQQLQERMEIRYPTQMFAQRIVDDGAQIKGLPAPAIAAFMELHPEFDFSIHQVEPFLQANGLAGNQSLTAGLCIAQRVIALTPHWGEMQHLLAHNLNSSASIASLGLATFCRHVEGVISAPRAELIYRRAVEVNAASMMLATQILPRFQSPSIAVLPAPSVQTLSAARETYPSLSALFGDLSYCECQHCRSVLSPAAYLVDLLRFLDSQHIADGQTALDVLLSRRPDLADLELSCENTNTEIPYVDLVLELLEQSVGLPYQIATPVDPADDFARHVVPPAVIDALKITTTTVGDQLAVALAERQPNANVSDWKITDGSRTWWARTTLRRVDITSKETGKTTRVYGDDSKSILSALNSKQIDASIEPYLAPESTLPLYGDPDIIQHDQHSWTITYSRAALIKLTFGNQEGTVQLLKLDGTPIDEQHYPLVVMQRIRNELNAQVSRDTLKYLLNLPRITYTINKRAEDWELLAVCEVGVRSVDPSLTLLALTYQNSSLQQDLAANAENRNQNAYNQLRKRTQVFPWSLPYDLWLDETRIFLEQLGVPRAQLIRLARPQSYRTEQAFVLEQLGMNDAEASIIAVENHTAPWAHWGLNEHANTIQDQIAGKLREGFWLDLLVNVSLLLQQSGLLLNELFLLLDTAFMHSLTPRLDVPSASECALSDMRLESLESRHLDRIHRFTRLWRRLRWSMHDLDYAIATLSADANPAITAQLLSRLALVQQLCQQTHLPARQILSWVGTLDTRGYVDYTRKGTPEIRSAYATLFLNPALQNPPDGDFALNSAGDELAYLKPTEPEHEPVQPKQISAKCSYVAAALGVNPDAVARLIYSAENRDGLIADTLTLANLSALAGVASLSTYLSISIESYLQLCKLLNMAPFTTIAPARSLEVQLQVLLDVIERTVFIQQTGFTVAELDYLLRHRIQPDSEFARLPDQHAQLLADLRSYCTNLDSSIVAPCTLEHLGGQLLKLGWPGTLVQRISRLVTYQFQPARVELGAMSLTIPTELRRRFYCRRVALRGEPIHFLLECVGFVSDTDFDMLAQAIPPQFARFVQELRDLHQRALDDLASCIQDMGRLMQAVELPVFTTVTRGNEVKLTDELGERLSFDHDTKTLALMGWLTEAEREQLLGLPNAGDFQAAVQQLYAQSLAYQPAKENAFVSGADADDLLRNTKSLERRFSFLLERLFVSLQRDQIATLQRQIVVRLSETFDLVAPVVQHILSWHSTAAAKSDLDWLCEPDFCFSSLPITSTAFPAQMQALSRLHKIALLLRGQRADVELVEWLTSSVFDVLDLDQLPMSEQTGTDRFEGWRELMLLFRLRDALLGGQQAMRPLVHILRTPPAPADELKQVLAQMISPENPQLADVENACAPNLLNMAAHDYQSPHRLLELAALIQVLRQMGASADIVQALIHPAPDGETAQLARRLHKAHFTTDQWIERLQPITDRLRERQRDAIAAHLMARYQLRDTNDLLDFYLIDVGMGSCLRTSRIKQALSALQLFVQRCLFNLEDGISPEVIDTQQWAWMKNYRVWEANRKVFLYPENWIEPELRDDKSEIFRALESNLQQQDLTHTTAFDAVRVYIDRLNDIAHLTVVAAFEEQVVDQQVKHIVARNQEQPYTYYYRRWLLNKGFKGYWTAWEEIKLPLEKCEHIFIFRLQGLIHIAWVLIASSSSSTEPWKVHLQWAHLTTEGWTGIKKSREMIMHIVPSGKDDATGFKFDLNHTDSMVSILCFGACEPVNPTALRPSETELLFPAILTWPILRICVQGKVFGQYPMPEVNGYLTKYITIPDANVQLYFDSPFESGKALPCGEPTLSQADGSFYVFAEFNWVDIVTYVMKDKSLDKLRFTISIQSDHVLLLNTAAVKTPIPFQSTDVVEICREYTWNHDFVFGLQEYPESLDIDPERPVTMKHLGGFQFQTDGSVTRLQPAVPNQDPNLICEYYASGLRERSQRSDGSDSFSITGSLHHSLWKNTPGRYFLSHAPAEQSGKIKLWAYRDNSMQVYIQYRDELYGNIFYQLISDGHDYVTLVRNIVYSGQIEGALATNQQEYSKPITVDQSAFVSGDLRRAVDFDPLMPYSNYNWELFFHVPFLVATQLSKNQRFADAQRWFHLLFDPTTNEKPSSSTDARRFWKFKPFRDAIETGDNRSIVDLLEMLAQPGEQPGEDTSLVSEIEYWRRNPFQPHAIARARVRSYQFVVVMKYLENVIAWADQLFRRYTMESINEATQLYILAARILGKRPMSIRPSQKPLAASYAQLPELAEHGVIDAFSNAWVEIEHLIAQRFATSQSAALTTRSQEVESRPAGSSMGFLYFCVPENEKLFDYWDTLDDRLFKIRHCMNIEGVEGQPPLFEPPIDPALLVRAAAAGLDIAAVLADLNAPLPRYRFNVMQQKAAELCAEVKSLGASLLATLEKRDAEKLALLRSEHEITMLTMVGQVRQQQINEAVANLVALRRTRQVMAEKYRYYQRLLGKTDLPSLEEGSPVALETVPLKLGAAEGIPGVERGLALLQTELEYLVWLDTAHGLSTVASIHNTIAGVLHAMPDITIGAPTGPQVKIGGSHYGYATNAIASFFSTLASGATHMAKRAEIIGGYERRRLEWVLQSNLAAKEIEQIDKQIVAAEIRQAIAEQELINHEQQLDNAREVDELMRGKYTNQQLYEWMLGQIAGVYFRTYQLAYDVARRAERTYRFELGLADSSFIQFGYWDSLKKGLMAGERLAHDLKRMEVAYLDQNQREYEITKHVSLLQLNPMALITLRETGRCEFAIPEALFDLDCPGHYMRRIKSVSVSVPCVTGPYTGVHCTLTLLSSAVRKVATGQDYGAPSPEDTKRFTFDYSAIQSIVTSSGQGDSGMFEANLRDERYLPFEGCGVISNWRLSLPSPQDFPQFDYDTISDVILHIRYTAREGGAVLRTEAVTSLKSQISQDQVPGSVRLFSVRHEFPTEWARCKGTLIGGGSSAELVLKFRPEHYPLWSKAYLGRVIRIDAFAEAKNPVEIFSSDPEKEAKADNEDPKVDTANTLNKTLGNLMYSQLTKITLASPTSELTMFLTDRTIENLWLAITWRSSSK